MNSTALILKVDEVMFFEPVMQFNSCTFNQKDEIHTFEVRHVKSEMRNLGGI